ncbi:MAG: putative beta-lysine N-acetyltransferase [Bacteroidota bacterium]
MTTKINTLTAHVSVYTDAFNKRIRIDYYQGDRNEVLRIIHQHISGWVEKLIVKSYAGDLPFFISNGFVCEAFIKGYFDGVDMYFVTEYFSANRKQSKKIQLEESIIEKIVQEKSPVSIPDTEGIKMATLLDIRRLADVYKEIFKIYPTPLSDEEHIRKTMKDGTLYTYIENENQIVSAASAEVNREFKNAELTDCATLPEAEGKGYMKKLLFFLEQKLKTDGITCCYTIARAESYSMNKVFAQLGYAYGGRLINNCFIYSGLEDMNVWYKSL